MVLHQELCVLRRGRVVLTVGFLIVAAAGQVRAQQPLPERAPEREDPAPPEPITVVVQGPPRHQAAPPRETEVAGSVITREQLAGPGLSAAEALRGEVGVQETELGGTGAPATASLRGATAEQTPVYLAGVRLNDEVGGVADLSQIPIWFLDRVEVYRGHGPVEAETLGIGGALYFEPRQPRRDEAATGAMVGSYGTRGAWAYAGHGDDSGGALAALRMLGAENDYAFEDDRGTLFESGDDRVARKSNADLLRHDAWFLLRRKLGAGEVSVVTNHTGHEQGAPKLALVPSRRARIDYERRLLGVVGRAQASPRLVIDAVTETVSTEQDVDDPARELALHVEQVQVNGQRVAQRLGATALLPFGLRLRFGGGVSAERLHRYDIEDARGREMPVVAARRHGVHARVAGEWPHEAPVRLRALVGVECRTTGTAAVPSLCSRQTSPWRIGPSVHLGRHALYGNVGHYVRAPSLGELYGVSFLVRGNPRLEPERALSAEAGWRYTRACRGPRRSLWVDVAVFSRWVDDLVTYVRAQYGHLSLIGKRRFQSDSL